MKHLYAHANSVVTVLWLACVPALVAHGDVAGLPTGADTLTVTGDANIAGAANPSGAIVVESGSATLTTNTPSCDIKLPAALRKGLTLWMDANTNVVWNNEKGGVVEWRDVRETGTDSASFRYIRAIIHEPASGFENFASVPPTYYNDTNNVFAGMNVVDFGEFGSGKWMYMANASGSITKVPTRAFFMVVGLHGTHGHILGDVKGLLTTGGETMFFHKGTGGSGDGNLANSSLSSCVMPLGETRLNSELVNPVYRSLPRNSFTQLTQNGPGIVDRSGSAVTPYFSTLFNQGNYIPSAGYTDRRGGGMIAELLVYDHVLPDDERRQVEAYLKAKWLGTATAGAVVAADGASLTFDASLPAMQISSLQGKGTLVKTGSHGFNVTYGTSMSDTALRVVSSGSIYMDQLRAPVYMDAEPGNTLITYDRSGFYARGAPRTGIVRTIGGGSGNDQRIMVDPDAIAGKMLQVTNATVILAPHSASVVPQNEVPSWVGTNLIYNGGFETPSTSSATVLTKDNSGWEAENNAYAAKYTSVWYEGGGSYTATNRFGSNVCALQGPTGGTNAKIWQTVVPPVTGTYRLSYYLSRRQSRTADTGDNAPVLLVALDGVPFHRNCVYQNELFQYNELNRYETLTPILVAGHEYVISFAVDDNTTKDRAVVLDEISLTPYEEGSNRVFIPNADLLSIGSSIPLVADSTGWYKASPKRTFWSMVDVGEGQEGYFGITMNSTWWTFRDAMTDDPLDSYRLSLYLQKDAAVTNTIVAPRSGRVRFSCKYANRSDSYENGSLPVSVTRKTGHMFEVSVGGRVIGSALPTSARWTEFSADFDIVAGEQELRIACVRPDSDDYTVLFREPQITYLTGEGETLAEIGVGETWNGTITAPSNGFYTLSFPAAGPACEPCSTDGAAINSKRYPACADMYIDGEKYAQLRVQNDTFQRFTLRLPYLAAGEHSLTFTLGTDIVASALRFKNFSLDPLPLESFNRDASNGTVFDIDYDAKLNLQYDGVFKISKLFIRGEKVFGRFSAATHPGLFSGPGILDVKYKGLTISLH